MLKKISVATIVMISSHLNAMENGAPVTHIGQYSGTHHHHYYNQNTFTRTSSSGNPIGDAATTVASAIGQGAVQGVFEGVGAVVAKTIVDAVYESPENKKTRNANEKTVQIQSLETLRDRVNTFAKFAEDTEEGSEIRQLALKMQEEYGNTLLEFLKKENKQMVSIITPFLSMLEKECGGFLTDTNNTDNEKLLKLRNDIQIQYGFLLLKQMKYEKEHSKPAIVIAVQ